MVSGHALESTAFESLLTHEMLHIYRTDTSRPSYDHDLMDRVSRVVIPRNHLTRLYQIRVLQEAINHLQDLHAEDVSFGVLKKVSILSSVQASIFFQDWIEGRPRKSVKTWDTWLNIGLMLNNCFVLSNMERHSLPDLDGKAQKKTERFLSQASQGIRTEYTTISRVSW